MSEYTIELECSYREVDYENQVLKEQLVSLQQDYDKLNEIQLDLIEECQELRASLEEVTNLYETHRKLLQSAESSLSRYWR